MADKKNKKINKSKRPRPRKDKRISFLPTREEIPENAKKHTLTRGKSIVDAALRVWDLKQRGL